MKNKIIEIMLNEYNQQNFIKSNNGLYKPDFSGIHNLLCENNITIEDIDSKCRYLLLDVFNRISEKSLSFNNKELQDFTFVHYYLYLFGKVKKNKSGELSYEGSLFDEGYVLYEKEGIFINLYKNSEIIKEKSGEPPFFFVKINENLLY